MHDIQLEIPVDSIESAIAAQAGGATRVELCADLSSGGTTPSAGLIALARNTLKIRLNIMIRPRAGDFCYSDMEYEVMQRNIVVAKHFGADGVVFGILTKEHLIDKKRTANLVQFARPLQVTFHRAFDIAVHPLQSLEEIIECGCTKLLTSGQKETAEEGLSLIKNLVEVSKNRISIMPASGIGIGNAGRIIQETGVKEIHAGKGVSDLLDSSDARMFGVQRMVVSEKKVRELKKIAEARG